MKIFKKFALIATLAFALAFPTVTVTTAGAANYTTPATGYTQASDVPDKKVGNYVVNWGARGENCTFLSRYASAFYTGSYTFDTMSKYSGSTVRNNVPSSALYKNLQSLMKAKHSHETGYQETRFQYCYTDCLKGNTAQISSFYSGNMVSGDWDSGATWNREHTWPNSKGLEGSDENDIMMLRPTSVSENSSRSNTAYGESSGYYDPNGLGTNVRGDCARIFLYVYVRWGNTQYAWGASGVMESVDVLLDWMEEDPVDTWEMGRNDAVQSITGTRNVFVDYPEYAWLLFGEDVPANVSTPSGNGGTVSGGNTGSGSGNTGSDSGNTGTDSGNQGSGMTLTENTPYTMYIEQKTVDKTLYLTGEMDGKFLAMTSDKAKAANVYAEKVTGGYKFYVLDGSAKSYITLTEYQKNNGFYGANISYSATGSVFYYNQLGCWACDLANEIFFLGTHSEYETTSASSSYYMTAANMGTTQFPLLTELATTDGGNTGSGNQDGGNTGTGSGNQGSGNTGSDSGNQGSGNTGTGSGNQGSGNTGTGSDNQGSGNTGTGSENEEESGPCEHEYGEWVITKEPTATEKGSKTRECEKCGRVVTQSIPKVEDEEKPAEEGCNATLGGAFAGVSITACLGLCLLKKKKQ